MAVALGVEPRISAFKVRCLTIRPGHNLDGEEGSDPSLTDSKSVVRPIHYSPASPGGVTRLLKLGFAVVG